MRSFIILLTAPLMLQSTQAMAWGTNGHRVTGKIADKFLSDEARAGITEILGAESIAEASTWPDFMRSDPSDFWKKDTPPWHYVTVPPGQTYSEIGPPEEGDAVAALAEFSDIVKDESVTKEQKQLALRFVIHIIEDLHQPLHNGKGDDRGGNSVKVTFMGEETNLHSVWDSGMIDREQLSYTEMANWLHRRITAEQQTEWQDTNPLTWIAESVAIRDRIYPETDPSDPQKIPSLGYSYVYQHKGDLDLRLQQGGVRLAAYLNELFQD